MALEPREPVELVVEFRSRLRIAVRQVDAGDDDTAYRGLDVAGFVIAGLSRQAIAGENGLGIAGQDGDAVPGLLSTPHCAVTGLFDRGRRKFAITCLQLLKCDDVGLRRSHPCQQIGQAAIDVVDVERRDLHVELPAPAFRTGETMSTLSFA